MDQSDAGSAGIFSRRTNYLRHGDGVRHLRLGGLAAEVRGQLLGHLLDAAHELEEVHGQADGPRLVGDGARHRLADPPVRVRAELVPAAVVEFLSPADEPHGALLDEVLEGHPAVEVVLGDGHHQAEVGVHHLVLGPPRAGEALQEGPLGHAEGGGPLVLARLAAQLALEAHLHLLED
eukprot:6829331-Pyramimonas_sp.AAC.1